MNDKQIPVYLLKHIFGGGAGSGDGIEPPKNKQCGAVLG